LSQTDPARPEMLPIHRAAILPQIPLNQLSAFPVVRPFRPGIGDHREFPLSLWERLRARIVKDLNADILGPGDPAGYGPLGEAIARYLGEVRGVKCAPDQVFLTSGLAESIQVITTAFMPPDGVVAMEEPEHLHAKAAFLATGARLMPLLVDEEGVMPPHSKRKNPPYLLFVTPGHQFPLGVTASLPQRLGLLEFVRQTGAVILEDDYDREFLDQSHLPTTLHSMDAGNSTLYTISFSKLLFSSLRLSAVVVPAAFTELFLRAVAVVCGPKQSLDQATLALFLKEGHFVSHMRYMRTIYQSRLSIVCGSALPRT
jgi:GntR family transcriptional regulator / MocR family aminotransferase